MSCTRTTCAPKEITGIIQNIADEFIEFFHRCTFKNTAEDRLLVNELLPELFVKVNRFQAAVDDHLFVAAFCNPFFSFVNRKCAKLFPAVFRQNDYAPNRCRVCVNLVESACRNRYSSSNKTMYLVPSQSCWSNSSRSEIWCCRFIP